MRRYIYKESLLKIDNFITIISSLGKGVLLGIGIGASLFGVLFMALAFNQDQSLNIGALVATLSGSACILIALNSKNLPTE